MKREQLARRLARESGISTAAAADQLDRIVHDILTRVRSGRSASLPGLGTFRPNRKQGFQLDVMVPDSPARAKSKKESR